MPHRLRAAFDVSFILLARGSVSACFDALLGTQARDFDSPGVTVFKRTCAEALVTFARNYYQEKIRISELQGLIMADVFE